jgi:hypothetical protein
MKIDMQKMDLALRVVASMKRIKANSEAYVQAFRNGREQGVEVKSYYGVTERSVAIAENRNSDDIVLYFGSPAIPAYGHTLTEKAYASRRFVRFDHTACAARIAVAYIDGGAIPDAKPGCAGCGRN